MNGFRETQGIQNMILCKQLINKHKHVVVIYWKDASGPG
jgi:hypothetical protein